MLWRIDAILMKHPIIEFRSNYLPYFGGLWWGLSDSVWARSWCAILGGHWWGRPHEVNAVFFQGNGAWLVIIGDLLRQKSSSLVVLVGLEEWGVTNDGKVLDWLLHGKLVTLWWGISWGKHGWGEAIQRFVFGVGGVFGSDGFDVVAEERWWTSSRSVLERAGFDLLDLSSQGGLLHT